MTFKKAIKQFDALKQALDDQGVFLDGLIEEIERHQVSDEVDACLSELANDIEREVDEMLNENKVTIGFKRLSDDAIIPTKAHPSDSGYDLFAAEDVIIEPGDTAVVKTGIAVELPAGYEAQIRPRSGVTAKTKLRVQLGTIDNSYQGELGVIVDNIAPIKYDTFSDDPRIALMLGRNREKMTNVMTRVNGRTLTEPGDRVLVGTYKIRKGDRLAQLVIQRLPETEAVEIDEFSDDSERGEGGFGSSGV